jgi:hypothetical protein
MSKTVLKTGINGGSSAVCVAAFRNCSSATGGCVAATRDCMAAVGTCMAAVGVCMAATGSCMAAVGKCVAAFRHCMAALCAGRARFACGCSGFCGRWRDFSGCDGNAAQLAVLCGRCTLHVRCVLPSAWCSGERNAESDKAKSDTAKMSGNARSCTDARLPSFALFAFHFIAFARSVDYVHRSSSIARLP